MGLADFLSAAVLSTRSDAIIAADADGVIRFWNPGAERIFGHSAGEAVGRSLDLIIPERLRQRHWDGYRQTVKSGESRYGEADMLAVPALRKDGATISIEFTIVPVKDQSGRVLGMGAIILNFAVIGEDSIVAAGTLVTERTVIPPRSMVMGSPGKVRRSLTDAEVAMILDFSGNYVRYRLDYMAAGANTMPTRR